MKKSIFLLMLLLLTCAVSFGQVREVTGIVSSSDDGFVMPGVSVTIQGTTIGAMTDNNGKYTIMVSDGQTLVFSFVGMKTQQILVNGQSTIDVVLESDLLKLEEVVVVGYGTAKKVGTVVGSLTQVKSEVVQDKPTANILDALQGKVAGMQVYTSSGEPSSLSSMRIHGSGSISGSSTPLYVVDGVPINESTMLTLNSNDFESVTVLKDASATSIYGTRAANGVVYITTKRGTTDQKGHLKISGQYGMSSIANTDFYESLCTTAQLTDFWVETGYRTQTYVDNLLAAYPNDTRWYKYYYQNAPSYSGDVSVSGGSGRTTYFVSGSYNYNKGIADRSLYDRYTGRANISSKVNDWMSLGVNLTGSTDERMTNAYGSNSTNRGLAMLAQPFYTPYDEDGNEYPNLIPGWNRYNPSYLAEKLPSVGKKNQFTGTMYIQLTPIEGLTIRTQAGMDAYNYRGSSKRMPSYLGSLNYGYVTESNTLNIMRTITNTVEYKFDINNVHNFTVLVGQEGIDSRYDYIYGISYGQTDDRLMLLNNGPDSRSVSSSKSENAYLSYFGRIDYSLHDKYFADFSLRQDASSKFGKNNRTANFWAAGIMWNAKKEDFLQNLDLLSSLNIKLSVGTSGNSGDINNYESLALITTTQYAGETGWVIDTSYPGNSSLQWESQLLMTLGFKFALFKDRYRFNIEFYDRQTENMLVDVPYPYTSGFDEILGNVGTLQNLGVDVAIDFDVIKTKNWTLTPYVNLNYNREKVTALFNDLDYWIVPNTGICWAVGKPVSFFYPLFSEVDPATGDAVWYEPGEDPSVTTKNATTTTFSSNLEQNTGKQMNAPLTGGFGFNLSYKSFSLQTDFTFAEGKYMINNDRYFFENPNVFSGYNQSSRILDYWKEPGDETTFPRYGVQFTQFDSRLVENASFLRLKNVAVSYTVPEAWLQKTKIVSSARVYVSGRNLLTWTNYLGPDPEVDSNLSLGAYPNTKQISVGAEIIF